MDGGARGRSVYGGPPHFSLTWSVERENSGYATVVDQDFAQRKDVVFNPGAKLPGEWMVDIHVGLDATNFPTLYAINHPGDDRAESFVT